MAFEHMLANMFASMFLRCFTDDLSLVTTSVCTSVCCLGLARNSTFWRELGTGVNGDLTRTNVADYTRLQVKVANSARPARLVLQKTNALPNGPHGPP
jgi:hypothetical protein